MIWYLVALLLGWLLTPLLFDLGFGLGSTAIIVASLYFTAAYIAPRLYLRYVYPPKAHRVLLALVNPLLKPPQGVPASLPLLERMNAATKAKDWQALRGMLSSDFAWVDGYGKRHGTKMYCCQLQNTPRIFPDYEQETREVLADPYDPNVLYVNTRTWGRPRRGPAFDMLEWSRWELAPGHEQVREIASAGVVSVT